MSSLQGFFKGAGVTVLIGSLLLTAACVSFKSGRKGINNVPSAEYVLGDSSQAYEIKPKSPQSVTVPSEGPLRITVEDAGLMALENNRALVVERLNPSIQQTYEDQEEAEFDPVIEAEVSAERSDTQRPSSRGIQSSESDIYEGSISLREFFPTGTFLEANVSTDETDSTLNSDPLSSTRLGLSVAHSLFRGHGTDVNLARLRQSRINTDITEYELRGFSESLLAQVENAYWDYALSQRRIEIVEESLKLAKQQLSETQEMIRVGKMAEAELAAVQAEVAAQLQGLINERSTLDSTRIRLLRLLNPPGETLWSRHVNLVHQPTIRELKLDAVEAHVAVAFRMRPEINQAKLDIQHGDLEMVLTKNGLLPKMDLFITLGKTGYARSFYNTVGDIKGNNYDILGGLTFEYPITNRDAKARHRRARLRRNQSEKALNNLEQLVELDVRNAYIEVNRTKEQITASKATLKFQEEKLRIETEKFRVGRSTNLLVSQAQRDLLVSRINEVQAVVNYVKALINLYRLDGSLLERRSISAPGRKPVELFFQK